MHKSLQFDELCALYAVSDVCLVSSTRDGMNLVSYEYIACQQQRQGVMILSEFAGAAQSLNGSIVVNPWDSQQVADAIHEAVTMDADTRAENQKKLFKVCSSLYITFAIRFLHSVTDELSYWLSIVRSKILRRILGYVICRRDEQAPPRRTCASQRRRTGGGSECRRCGKIPEPRRVCSRCWPRNPQRLGERPCQWSREQRCSCIV